MNTETFRLPFFFLDETFLPHLVYCWLSPFPRMKFLRKNYETKIIRKEKFMDPTLCFIYYLA
jgi:hypothetical protein